MYIDGSGITEPFEFRTKLDYGVDTVLALKWTRSSSGTWHATDRGSSNDYYESTISMAGLYPEISNVLTQLNNNRIDGSNEITLSRFNDNEKIFGADVVHGDLTATVLSYPTIIQKSFRMFVISMKIRLIGTPSFYGSETLPELRYTQFGYDGNIDEFTITKYDTYNGNFSYIDEQKDTGKFIGKIILSNDNMAALRRYHAVNRGGYFSLSDIPGIVYPFSTIGDTYPVQVQIKQIYDEKMIGLYRWICTVELVEYK